LIIIITDNSFSLRRGSRPGTVVLGRWLSTRLRRPSTSTHSVRLTLWPAPSYVHRPPTVTGVLPLLAHECGTLCQPN